MRSGLAALSLLLAAVSPAIAEPDGKPTVVPAVLRSVSPTGAARGGTVTFTLEGARLAGATGAFFDDPAISGRVLPSEDPKKPDQVRVEATVGSETRVGIHRLFVQTPHGTTGSVTFAVGAWPETRDAEPNDTRTAAQPLSLPTTVLGDLEKVGDTDCFRVEARAGQELVFQVVAPEIRSRLSAVLTLTDGTGRVLAGGKKGDGQLASLLGHRFGASGTYFLEVRDFENAAGKDVYYRLNVGEFSIASSTFPLGLQRGASVEVSLTGFNLGPQATMRVTASEEPPSWGKTMPLPGELLVAPRLAVGEDPEVVEVEVSGGTADSAPPAKRQGQRVPVPITINGRISSGVQAFRGSGDCAPTLGSENARRKSGATGRLNARCDSDEFRFAAKRGKRLILEVTARRLGSPLDSFIEVLDTWGRPIERATIRPVAETSIVLSDPDSSRGSFRIQSWTDLAVNDYVFVGRELLQITRLPGGPDEDANFRSLRGRRIGFLDTTPEAHSVGTSVYKVQVHPPGRSFPPNGMPLFRLFTQNDDGGALYGSDSRLTFDPPADGEYLVRITDVRGQEGPDYAYRLSIRPPRPDYRLTMSPSHPNLLRGSSTPVTVSIERHDGFNGPVEVRLEGLPAGFSATPGVIAAGADSVTLTIAACGGREGFRSNTEARSNGEHGGNGTAGLPSAPPSVRDSVASVSPSLRVTSGDAIRLVGRAWIAGREILRSVEPEQGVRLLTVLPDPDIRVTTDLRQVALRPGGTVEVVAKVERRNGFKGRVPIDVRNLPFGVQVLDVGLNGVLVTEQQSSRRFVLTAEPWVRPQTRPFYAVGRVESDPATEIASEPIVLSIAR